MHASVGFVPPQTDKEAAQYLFFHKYTSQQHALLLLLLPVLLLLLLPGSQLASAAPRCCHPVGEGVTEDSCGG
jgi:hypothetical protein